jgi:hypothetical protein
MNNKEKLLIQINKKLDTLIILNVVNLSASKELDNSTKVRLLSLARFTSEEIGKMIGLRADSVRRIRSKPDKEKSGKKKVNTQLPLKKGVRGILFE